MWRTLSLVIVFLMVNGDTELMKFGVAHRDRERTHVGLLRRSVPFLHYRSNVSGSRLHHRTVELAGNLILIRHAIELVETAVPISHHRVTVSNLFFDDSEKYRHTPTTRDSAI